jgi:hypothetical protein
MGQFSLNIEKFVEKAKGNAEVVIKKIAYDIFTRVVFKTPVDTGAARANWLASVGTFVGPKPNTGNVDPEATHTTLEIAKIVDTFTLQSKNLYLANNLPYILPLENGHSKQAPSGMVALTLQEFPQVVNNAVAGKS